MVSIWKERDTHFEGFESRLKRPRWKASPARWDPRARKTDEGPQGALGADLREKLLGVLRHLHVLLLRWELGWWAGAAPGGGGGGWCLGAVKTNPRCVFVCFREETNYLCICSGAQVVALLGGCVCVCSSS